MDSKRTSRTKIAAILALQFLTISLLAGEYFVRPGDTLWSIAKKTGLSVAQLEKLNNIKNSTIYAGQKLITDSSPKNSNTYRVVAGDSLWSIARKYNLSLDELKRVNNLENDIVYRGQSLLIPNKSQTLTSVEKKSVSPKSPFKFLWPLEGSLIEKYGVKDKGLVNGITIASRSTVQVRCSASGEVAYVGTLRGYGNLVIIRHQSGYHSVYAHLSQILVSKGEVVQSGNSIGRAGEIPDFKQFGVHFQIYHQGVAIDPLKYLQS